MSQILQKKCVQGYVIDEGADIFSQLLKEFLFSNECLAFGVAAAAGIGAAYCDSVSCADAVVIVLTFFCVTFNFAVHTSAVTGCAVYTALFVFVCIAFAYCFFGSAGIFAFNLNCFKAAASVAVVVAVIYFA